MSYGRGLSEADRAEVAVRYQGGASTTELAARFGVAVATINRALPADAKRAKGWPNRRHDVGQAEIVRLREEENLTYEAIGARLGINGSTVQRRYLRHLAACRNAPESMPG